jgi:hypothetical protein
MCTKPDPTLVQVRVEPAQVFLTPCAAGASDCATRRVNVIVDPDVCSSVPVSFASSNEKVTPTPAAGAVDLYKASVALDVKAGAEAGSATIKVSVPRGDGQAATATIAVEVLDPTVPACAAGDTVSIDKLAGGGALVGKGGLAAASISLPQGADTPNHGSFLWGVEPFATSISCGDAAPPTGFSALGPAVTFGPLDKRFQREVPLSIPVNPALLPPKARLRHVRVAFSSPAFKAPRVVPVADPHLEKVGDQWALTFKAPRLGTYQAVVAKDAGEKMARRRITHRAVIGVSMGGGGTAMFGMRHHNLFDVLAPLGGPVDWTWMLNYIEKNVMGGFRPIKPGTVLADIPQTATPCSTSAACAADETCMGQNPDKGLLGTCAPLLTPSDPYEHTQVFNHWWYEYPRSGTGGSFDRNAYIQIFRDLSVMFGNPNGENLAPGAERLPAGVPPTDKSVVGDHAGDACAVWMDPLDGPDKATQEELAQNCPKERCAHTLTLQNYFDDEFNPDGTFPVITVCDGSPQNQDRTPYANTWTPQGNDYPLELSLAVDYNGNGVRDEMEPLIRAGHEPWEDVGTDGLPDAKEPGYQKGVNDDPSGDNYDPQYNPTGTEGNFRYEQGEPWKDVGLDGVAGTKQQPAGGWQKPGDGYDVGEGDGKFTISTGLRRFWERDAHSIVRNWSEDVPAGKLDDAALSRVDVWTDGGTRDLFNFMIDAQHLAGALSARGRGTAYFTDFAQQPGADPSKPNEYNPSRVSYADMPGVVLQRYGKVDPTPQDIEDGSGQHVGTANELIGRLSGALFFIGSRWPEPELRTLVANSSDDPAPNAQPCEVIGACTFEFKSSSGRTGPVGVTLPPGYAHKDQQDRHYPVVFLLHGYGQEPQDLVAATPVLRTWMNSTTDGMESRLPKAILVYVDGRCRMGPSGKPECIRGTFFADSPSADRGQSETWWLELMDYIDKNYRTMGEAEIDWTE